MNMKDVLYTVEDEGLDYAMCNYSDWSDIKDTKFHELRNTFLNAKNELEQYIKYKANGKNA